MPSRGPASSFPEVSSLHQSDVLPAEDRVPQLVDRMAPPVELLRPLLARAARTAREHGHQRGQFLVGGVALEDAEHRRRMLGRCVERDVAWVGDLADVYIV